MFDKCTIYYSHPIRGSNNDFEGNCKKAVAAAKRLRNVFPEVDFYVPAEHDLAMQWLYFKKKVSENDILAADLHILQHCDGWFFYKFDESKGGTIEQDAAIELGFCDEYDCIFIMDIEKASYSYLRKAFGPLVEAAKRRFRRRNERI